MESLDEEEREVFMDELYAKESSDDVAKQMLREHFEAAGIKWDEEI